MICCPCLLLLQTPIFEGKVKRQRLGLSWEALWRSIQLFRQNFKGDCQIADFGKLYKLLHAILEASRSLLICHNQSNSQYAHDNLPTSDQMNKTQSSPIPICFKEPKKRKQFFFCTSKIGLRNNDQTMNAF